MAQKVATEQLTISEWVKGLAAIPVREFTLQNVQDYVVPRRPSGDARQIFLFLKGQLHAQSDFQE